MPNGRRLFSAQFSRAEGNGIFIYVILCLVRYNQIHFFKEKSENLSLHYQDLCDINLITEGTCMNKLSNKSKRAENSPCPTPKATHVVTRN